MLREVQELLQELHDIVHGLRCPPRGLGTLRVIAGCYQGLERERHKDLGFGLGLLGLCQGGKIPPATIKGSSSVIAKLKQRADDGEQWGEPLGKLSTSQIEGGPMQPKHQIVTDKIRAVGMQFGGDELLKQTVAELVKGVEG